MRKAEDFIRDYRERGYDDDRIRVLASLAREPLRSQVLEILGPSQKLIIEPSTTAEDYDHPRRGSPKDITRLESDHADESESVEADAEAAETIDDAAHAENPSRPKERIEMEKEIARLKAELGKSHQRIAELEEEASVEGDHSDKVDELNEEVGRSHTREAELQALMNEEKNERREAESRADELAEQLKEQNGTLNHLRSVLADKEKQLAELRGRSEGDELRIKNDLENECRKLMRRSDYYRKLAIAGTAAAALIFVISLFASRIGGAPSVDQPDDMQTAATNGESTETTTETASARETRATETRSVAQRDTRATDVQRPRPINANDGELTGVTGSPFRTTSARSSTSQPASTTLLEMVTVDRQPSSREPEQPKTITYEVKRGDSLWIICRDVLGDPGAVNRVARENNLSDPSRLQPGMKLTLTVANNN